MITFSHCSVGENYSYFYQWVDASNYKLEKTFHRTYIDEDTVHYEIYIAEDLIVDEILSSEDADVNWDQYERFFGLRVSDKLEEDNQTRYIGIIPDKDDETKSISLEFIVREHHLIM